MDVNVEFQMEEEPDLCVYGHLKIVGPGNLLERPDKCQCYRAMVEPSENEQVELFIPVDAKDEQLRRKLSDESEFDYLSFLV